jgi:hypothetical protein
MPHSIHAAELVSKVYKTSVTQTFAFRRIHPEKIRGYQLKKRITAAVREHSRRAKKEKLRAVALTLTYRNNADFCSKDITRFIARLRARLSRKGFPLPYTWVLETKARLHYHLQVWLPRCLYLTPSDLKCLWKHGTTWARHCWSVIGWADYMRKRATKTNLPKGTRAYGIGGLDDEGRLRLHRARLPAWLHSATPANAWLKRVKGAGWADTCSGEIYVSPWSAFALRGGFYWRAKRE